MHISRRQFVGSITSGLVLSSTKLGTSAEVAEKRKKQLVYVGGSRTAARRQYTRIPEEWEYVRRHADGWYINNFALDDDDAKQLVSEASSVFANKKVFFESDMGASNVRKDKSILKLLSTEFEIPFCCLNNCTGHGLSAFAERRKALKEATEDRRILVQIAPWTLGGDIVLGQNDAIRNLVRHANGTATDGPMSHWRNDYQEFREGTASTVLWTEEQNPNLRTMVMFAPNQLNGKQFFDSVVECVKYLEAKDAVPDIWAFSFYGPDRFHDCPVLPESFGADDRPANTFMGAAYWLIKRIKG